MTQIKTRCVALAVLLATSLQAAEEPMVKHGDTIVFLGDSITNYGSASESGYVRMVVSGLKANGIAVKWFNAGIPGNKAWQMLERFERDVTDRNPQLVTISCGVNDVWFLNEQSSLENYKKQVAQMVEKAKQAGIKVMLLTPTTAFGEQPNAKIAQYAEYVREYAKEHKIPLADTQQAVRKYIDSTDSVVLDSRGNKATVDGVHMAPMGNREMARVVLIAMGLTPQMIQIAETAWSSIPHSCKLTPSVAVPYDDYQRLESMADTKRVKIEELFSQILEDGIASLLQKEEEK